MDLQVSAAAMVESLKGQRNEALDAAALWRAKALELAAEIDKGRPSDPPDLPARPEITD